MWTLRTAMMLVAAAVACPSATSADTHVSSTPSLQANAQTTLAEMKLKNPDLGQVLDSANSYVVFPNIGKASALVVGGAYGKGMLFERGKPSGVVSLKQGSIGPQLGGESFAELIVFYNDFDTKRLKAGTFDLGGDASAVILKSGGHVAATAKNGVAVFVMPRGGAIAGLSVTGQKLDYRPGPG